MQTISSHKVCSKRLFTYYILIRHLWVWTKRKWSDISFVRQLNRNIFFQKYELLLLWIDIFYISCNIQFQFRNKSCIFSMKFIKILLKMLSNLLLNTQKQNLQYITPFSNTTMYSEWQGDRDRYHENSAFIC